MKSEEYGEIGDPNELELAEMSTEKVSLVAQVKVSNQELLSTKEVIVEGIDMERERSASLQRELQEAMEQYTNDKQFKEKKEATVELQSLHEGLMEKAITSDGQSQTDDPQEYIRSLEMECERLREIEKIISEKDVLLKERQELQNILEMELQTTKAEALAEKEKKIAEEAAWKEMKQGFCTEIEALKIRVLELQRAKEEEQTSIAQNLELVKKILREDMNGYEDGMRFSKEMELLRMYSMMEELKCQVQSEQKRAEEAEKRLDYILGMSNANVCTHGNAHMQVAGLPSTPQNCFKVKDDEESSLCSWPSLPEFKRSFNHDSDEESSSSSVSDAFNARLINRFSVLRMKLAKTTDLLNKYEEENSLLRKEVIEKSEKIAHLMHTICDTNHSPQMSNSSAEHSDVTGEKWQLI
uniref:Uncharacterized protein n=1 Tax=Wuchereria bancrofti TaxID=6293 RepID=A0AAF5PIT6_WUCBA